MKKFIICGPGASGKDHLVKLLQKKGYTKDISYTTRPPRKEEVHGIDYVFVPREVFENFINQGRLYEYDVFDNNYYGTALHQWESCQLFIMTPGGIAKIKPEDRDSCLIIYLDIEEDIRRDRLFKRGITTEQVEKRIAADRKDFKDFKDYDIIIKNHDF